MKKVYRLILVAAAMIISMVVQAAGYRTLIVERTDGVNLDVPMTDDLTTTFGDDNIYISDPGAEIEFELPMALLKGYHFVETAAIGAIGADGSDPVVDLGTLTFSGLPTGSHIQVFDPSGRLMQTATPTEGVWQLDRSQFGCGLYVITVNGVSYKLIVR